MANFSVVFKASGEMPANAVDGRLVIVKGASSSTCSMYFEHDVSGQVLRLPVVPTPDSDVAQLSSDLTTILSKYFEG